MEKNDCDVCKKMQRFKNKQQSTPLLIAFIVVAIIASVFITLYMTSGSIVLKQEDNVKIELENDLDNGSTANNNIITGSNSTINGTIESKSDTGLYIMLSVIFASLIITGGIVYASKNRRDIH